MLVVCKGEKDSICLRVPGEDRRPSTALAPVVSRREFEGTSTNALSANSLKPIVVDPAASTAGGRQYVFLGYGQVFKVLGIKMVVGPQTPGAPECKYIIRLHTLMIH